MDRVEALLAGELAQEKFGAAVDKTFQFLEKAALEDAALWPAVGEALAVRAAPAQIKENFGLRAGLLKRVIVEERSTRGPPLVLNEILASPAEGGPWIEVRNVSTSPVSLADYRLTASFRTAGVLQAAGEGVVPFQDRKLAPGECYVLATKQGSSLLSPAGGFLALYRVGPKATPSVVQPIDFLFYGHQTKGLSYGRMPEGADEKPGGWAFLSHPTPGKPSDGPGIEPPPHAYREGLSIQKSGAAKVWLRLKAASGAAAGDRPPKLALRYRREGEADFRSAELTWDDKSFWYSGSIEVGEGNRRIAYYALASSADGVERLYPLPAPDLSFAVPVLPGVKINEVLPRPQRVPSSPGEFVELHNASDRAADLDGYFLTDTRRNTAKWRIPKGSVVEPKGFIILYADGLDEGSHTSFKLSNSGGFIGLYGRMEEGNLLVDSTVFRGMRVGESWGAMPDGSRNFRIWKDPTPGARNLPKIPDKYLKGKEGGAPGEEVEPPTVGNEEGEKEGVEKEAETPEEKPPAEGEEPPVDDDEGE